MHGLWIVKIATLFLCGSASPTKREGFSAIDLDMDHRGRAVLMRKHHQTSGEQPTIPPASYDARWEQPTSAQLRYRREALGTAECGVDETGVQTVPVQDEMDCMTAATALNAEYQPVGYWGNAPEGCVIQEKASGGSRVLYVKYPAGYKPTTTDFPDWAMVCDGGEPIPCPAGYHKEVGETSPQWGNLALGSFRGGMFADTIGECKNLCSADSRCMSFKWSPTYTWTLGSKQQAKLVCILHCEHHVKAGLPPFRDFVFCAKTQATIDASQSPTRVCKTNVEHQAEAAAAAAAASTDNSTDGSAATNSTGETDKPFSDGTVSQTDDSGAEDGQKADDAGDALS